MAKSVNKVILVGNVGSEPEIRSSQNGNAIATFSFATNERHKDASGNWVDATEWHSIKAFKRTAEIVRDYVHKGDKMYIEGKLSTSSWEDKESGQNRYRTEIIVNDLSLLAGANK